MAKLRRDHDRYIVFNDEQDRIGFVRKAASFWNAADTTMEHSRNFPTRAAAVRWLEELAEVSP